jgi:hypothetical protein
VSRCHLLAEVFLRRSPKDVNDAIVRATDRVASIDHQKPPTTLALGEGCGEDA